jgi:hypothetical protein
VSRWNQRGLQGAGTGGASLALRAPSRVMKNPCLPESRADPKIGCGLCLGRTETRCYCAPLYRGDPGRFLARLPHCGSARQFSASDLGKRRGHHRQFFLALFLGFPLTGGLFGFAWCPSGPRSRPAVVLAAVWLSCCTWRSVASQGVWPCSLCSPCGSVRGGFPPTSALVVLLGA